MPDPTETAAALDRARAAHASAIANHAQAVATAARARDRHQAAVEQRQRLLDAAASGGGVVETDLVRADTAAADARDTMDLHAAVCVGALTGVHRAEINVLVAAAQDHASRANLARQAAVDAAALVDQAISTARAVLVTFLDRLGDLRSLREEASQHNAHVLPQASAANKVLGSLHPSQRPKFVDVPINRPVLALQVVSDTGQGLTGGGTRIVHSVTQYAAVLAPVAAAPAVVQATQAA